MCLGAWVRQSDNKAKLRTWIDGQVKDLAWMGQGRMASDQTAEVDYSGTTLAGFSGIDCLISGSNQSTINGDAILVPEGLSCRWRTGKRGQGSAGWVSGSA